MSETVLSMQHIHKQFPGVYALQDVHFELRRGEVHALLGENGAGKSTLMKTLAGIYSIDRGHIAIHGEPCHITDVHSSLAKGVSVIHQELCLVPYMTIAENIFLGREPLYPRTDIVNFPKLNADAQQVLDALGMDVRSTDKVVSLSVAQQQMVEIAKALSVDAEIIVMDEPTSSLTDKEVDILFQTIRDLQQQGISIVYISHRMEEIFEITNRITVLRDGRYIGTRNTAETTKDELIAMMVGRELQDLYITTSHATGDVVLDVQNVSKKDVLHDMSFSLRKGEILGISGLVGAGRTELARVIFGIDSHDSGAILVEGRECTIQSAADAMRYGIALVPENRKEQGLVLIKSVGYNITLQIIKQLMRFAKVDEGKEEVIVSKYIRELSVKTPSARQLVRNLSGGNQQKVVIAKWLATQPKVLILDEPTRGIDVGAKAEIYAIMSKLAQTGVGILMISSELPEIINMSDMVMVMHNGTVAGMLGKEDFNQETIMHYATGGIH
ncbi:MAG: sugar ABC transporter ATP-binding protein [bacterium]|nr:sugar ABC transporter ATP-binding protein [bacterium]